MSLILLKISVNVTGFLVSYISAEPKYIPGILIGIVLMLFSIIIPGEKK